MKKSALTIAVAAAMTMAMAMAPAFAGNIVLTGHDNDFHYTEDPSAQAGAALLAEANFVKNGSALPILVFDNASSAANGQLTQAFTGLGVSFFWVDPSVSTNITDALFDFTKYSAFAVASQQSCGGCDNTTTDVANIAAHVTAITAFFNAGGGILGLAGAENPNAYSYVPTTATNAGGAPDSSGYVQTAAGATYGIPAVNGDPTHNFFAEPGSGGLSSAYQVTERWGDAFTGTPETVVVFDGKIGGGGITGGGGTPVPEPGELGLFALGLLAIGFMRRRVEKA